MLNRSDAGACLVALALCFTLACSDDSGNNGGADSGRDGSSGADLGGGVEAGGGTPDSGVATASFEALTPYSVYKGTAKIAVTVVGTPTKLELLVDDKVAASLTAAPWTFSWDTTKSADGVRALALQVNGDKGDGAVSVIVLNQGETASWTDKNTGTVIVPKSGYVEQHLKFHWNMPSGVKQVITVLTWDKGGFEMELAIGVGECPDSGTTATSETGKTSPLAATYPDPAGSGSLGTGQWFAHVAPKNPEDVLGMSTKFSLQTYFIK